MNNGKGDMLLVDVNLDVDVDVDVVDAAVPWLCLWPCLRREMI